MKILVINSGSSSIRFRIAEVSSIPETKKQASSQALIQGALQGIGSLASLEISEREKLLFESSSQIDNHEQAFKWVFDSLRSLQQSGDMTSNVDLIEGVGHRVVHGGHRFSESTVIDDEVLHEIEQLNDLAPLHNPACLAGMYGAREFLSHAIPMVAVFDTMFHQTMPMHAKTYAIPYKLTERHHIIRYGFHGIAHAALADSYALHTRSNLNDQRLITVQLGNGCSMTAIAYGQSVDTSMGFTPSEGLMMGTRSGDLDPSIMSYLVKKEQVPVIGVQSWLNEHSGLLGVSGRTNDMRQLLQAANHEQDARAKLAIDMFCYRIRKYLGAYLVVLGGADAIVFGGGIGEGAPAIRAQICEGMDWCGLRLHEERNKSAVGLTPGSAIEISLDGADIAAYVIGTDEESWIASETERCLRTHRSDERSRS